MSEYLKEAGWKKVLSEKKNLGLKIMGTGVSKKIRDCETLYDSYLDGLKPKGKDLDSLKVVADNYLHGLAALITHLNNEVGKHPLFPTAMAYLKNVLAEAKKRELQVKTQMKIEKEQWLQNGKTTEKLAVKNAPSLSEIKKLFVQANVALVKATKIEDLIDKNSMYQTTLTKISKTQGVPMDLQHSVTNLQFGPRQQQKDEFTKVKNAMTKAIEAAIAKVPKQLS